VAGQNFGARRADRVRETFRTAVTGAAIVMIVFALLSHVAPAAMIGLFSNDPQVIAYGDEYLRIISWSYVASGVIFVCSSLFQAMGNTIPSLVASGLRIAAVAGVSLVLASRPGFQLHSIWILSVVAVALQMVLCLVFLRREFRLRLDFADAPAPNATAAPVEVTGAAGEL
jgi:Na+-driven multidrug efflux pump